MKKNFLLLLFIFIMSSFSYAQTFQAGFKFDNEQLSTSPEKLPSSGILFFTSAHITGSVSFTNDLALEARLGYNWQDFYRGPEAGIFVKYYYKDVYAICGIAYHHIKKEISITEDGHYFSLETDLLMPDLGLGFSPVRNFAIELTFLNGLNKKIGNSFNQQLAIDNLYHPISEVFPDINLNWVTKLGISYSFSF